MVTILSGANEATAQLAGQTVSQVREAFKAALNIPDTAVATVNGRSADAGYALRDGDELSFVKDTAQKG